MAAWPPALQGTWLGSEWNCKAIDEKVKTHLAAHWHQKAPSFVPPFTIKKAARWLGALGPNPDDSILCTLVLAVLGELLLCAEPGGILRETNLLQRFGESEQWVAVEGLRLVRNAVCHPAEVGTTKVADGDGEDTGGNQSGVTALASFLGSHHRDESWAQELRTDPNQLASREAALFTLRQVDSIGRMLASRWGIQLRKPKK